MLLLLSLFSSDYYIPRRFSDLEAEYISSRVSNVIMFTRVAELATEARRTSIY